jgi:ribosomal protein S1
VAIGDEVKVALDALENGFGETVLSREKAKRSMVWDELEKALEANATVNGRISGKVKGGFTVDIKDVRAFLPGSLVDVRPVRDPPTSKARNSNSRSSSSIASATTSWSRAAPWSRASSAPSASS